MASVMNGRFEVQKLGPYGTTALFGYTRSSGNGKKGDIWHGGIDGTCPDQPTNGTDILAIEDGVVTQSRIVNNGVGKGTAEWGNYVTYLGKRSGMYFTNAHLASRAVKVGQSIKAGQKIGVMGNTGNAAGGYKHLHFEARRMASGAGVNPAPYLGIKNAVGIYGAAPAGSTPSEAKQNPAKPMTFVTVGPASIGDKQAVEAKAIELKLPVVVDGTKEYTLEIGPMTSGDNYTLTAMAESLKLPVKERLADYRLTVGPISAGDRNTFSGKCKELALNFTETKGNSGTTMVIGPVSYGDKNTLENMAAGLLIPYKTVAE